jgi:hypothetical protein
MTPYVTRAKLIKDNPILIIATTGFAVNACAVKRAASSEGEKTAINLSKRL